MTLVTYLRSPCEQCLPMVPTMAYDVFSTVNAAFESLGKVVVFLDGDLRIVAASPGFRGILGLPELEGRLLPDLVEGPDLFDCLRAKRRCTGEVRLRGGRVVTASGGALNEGFAEDARYVVTLELDDDVAAGDGSEDAERILRALEMNRWRRSDAARALGISRATLWRRMREFRIL